MPKTNLGGRVISVSGIPRTNAWKQNNQNAQQAPPPQTPQVQNPTPTQTKQLANPFALNDADSLSKMSDQQLVQLLKTAKNVDMPNHLSDRPDFTQRFVYTAGVNGMPLALDAQQFQQFMKDNNIPQRQVLSRSVNRPPQYYVNGTPMQLTAQQTIDLLRDGKYNYIGGKWGGQALGAGTYFDMNGGGNTGYGGTTVQAVLNPKTAKIIQSSTLSSKIQAYRNAHPSVAKLIPASNSSVYALLMGYNVIKGSSYHNIIDRIALVIKK